MDIAFGDTAAHEEKLRLYCIAAELGLTEDVPEKEMEETVS